MEIAEINQTSAMFDYLLFMFDSGRALSGSFNGVSNEQNVDQAYAAITWMPRETTAVGAVS